MEALQINWLLGIFVTNVILMYTRFTLTFTGHDVYNASLVDGVGIKGQLEIKDFDQVQFTKTHLTGMASPKQYPLSFF